MPGQAPAQIRTGPVVSQTGSTVTVEISDAPVEATATDGLVYAPGSEVMCLTTPDRVIVLGSADGSTVSFPGWQPVNDAATGMPIVDDPQMQGTTQPVLSFGGTWRMLRVTLVGGTDITSLLRVRVNDDTTGNHQSYGSSRDATAAASADPFNWALTISAWQIGRLEAGLANTSHTIVINRSGLTTAAKAFHAFGHAAGDVSQSGGRTAGLTDTAPVHSLRLIATGGAVFDNSTLVTIEGLRS